MFGLFFSILSVANVWANTLDCSEPANSSVCDADGDGVISSEYGGNDCDDSDASVVGYRYYTDADADGYGDFHDDGFVSCYVIPVYSLNNDDCDDNLSHAFPGSSPNDSNCLGNLGSNPKSKTGEKFHGIEDALVS